MKRDNVVFTDHPSDAELDRLRAGLTEATGLHSHVRICARCEQRLNLWPQVCATLAQTDGHLTGQLAARRRRALDGKPAHARRRPMVLAAAFATLAALTVGIGVFVQQGTAPTLPTTAQAEGVPDIYADLDFYLWLLEKQSDAGDAPSG